MPQTETTKDADLDQATLVLGGLYAALMLGLIVRATLMAV